MYHNTHTRRLIARPGGYHNTHTRRPLARPGGFHRTHIRRPIARPGGYHNTHKRGTTQKKYRNLTFSNNKLFGNKILVLVIVLERDIIYIIIALRLARLDAKGFLLAARWGSLRHAKCAYAIPILEKRLKLQNKYCSTVLELQMHRKLTTVAAILYADAFSTMTASSMATVARLLPMDRYN